MAFLEVVAPPGRLGISIGAHVDGHACIYAVKAASPLAGRVGIGDVVVEIDGEDTSKHTHAELVACLAGPKLAGVSKVPSQHRSGSGSFRDGGDLSIIGATHTHLRAEG